MSRYNHTHIIDKKGLLFRLIVPAFVVGILTLFMPRAGISHLESKIGEPWNSDPVIAKDSFFIYKSEAQLQHEQDSLRQFYETFFSMDKNLGESQIKRLRDDFHSMNVPHYYLNYLTAKLFHVYERGILETSDHNRVMQQQSQMVSIYQLATARTCLCQDIYTEKTAYEYLTTDEDSIHFPHSVLASLNLQQYVQANLSYDERRTQLQHDEVDKRLIQTKGKVKAGQKIVDRGDIVDDEIYSALHAMEIYENEHRVDHGGRWIQTGSQLIYVSILTALLFVYFHQFRSDYLESRRTVLLLVCLCLFFPLLTYGIVSHKFMSVYMIPYCILPVLVRIFLDSRTAFMAHMLTILASSVILEQPLTFIVTETVGGLVSIYALRELTQRSEIVRMALLTTVCMMLTYLCLGFITGECLAINDLATVSRWPYYFIIGSGFLSLLVYVLLVPIERVFGFTSVVTLVELQNVNHPLLHALSEKASGTFNHSMQVANLAVAVAKRIGAKEQLVRTGALYHDIGKIENAAFFTENQSGTNPHQGLSYERSAQIIIKHVTSGLALADKYRLPQEIKDFIATHHGRSKTLFFYNSQKNEHPDLPIDEETFTYPGPKPQTAEQAILMMVDAVEATSRSLTEHTEEGLNAVVDKIIDAQTADGCFSECAITLRDISEAKEELKMRLRTVYHTRIKYPELEK